MGMTVGKRTRSCCPISENRSQTSALSCGPGNLFNPTFLCRELSWDGHREKGNEEKGENSYLFLRGKTTFGRNVVPQEAQHFQADPAKCFSMNLRNAFFALFPSSQVCRHFCFSLSRSLFFYCTKKCVLFSLVFTTCCHPTCHLYFK